MQPKYRVAAIESTTFERRWELSASSPHDDNASWLGAKVQYPNYGEHRNE